MGCAALLAATGGAAWLASSLLSDATSEDELTSGRKKPSGRPRVRDIIEGIGEAIGWLGGLITGNPGEEVRVPMPEVEVIEEVQPPVPDTTSNPGR